MDFWTSTSLSSVWPSTFWLGLESLVVVVDRYRELPLRKMLTDDVLVEKGLDLRRGGTFWCPQEMGLVCAFSRMMSKQSLMHSEQM